MQIYKRFIYRIYPNKTTINRLDQWNSALKWLWNIANEQRLNGYSRSVTEKIYPSYLSQCQELTALRKIASWINDVPRHVCASILEILDNAWQRCFDRLAKQPKWKKRSDHVNFTESDQKVWSIRNNNLYFPKLSPIKLIQHRPLEGKPKSCTIKRDGDQWFASILCEVEIPDPEPRTEPRVGIDRGVRNLLGDSDRRLLPNPKFLEKQLPRLARAQRTVSRRVKGSKNREKAKNRVSRINRKIRRQRDHLLHVESSRYAKSHGIVVLEKLNTAGMIQGNLSRHIADSGWGKFAQYLGYKLEWTGGQLLFVDPKYTSQTCAVCTHVDRASRLGDKFKCTQCGHEDHADLNAPVNILNRASRSVQPVEASSQGTRRRSRKYRSTKVDFVLTTGGATDPLL